MVTNDRPGKKKIQCWINGELWNKVEALNIPNQTIAVTHALELLVSQSNNIPNESQDIPRLEATVEGLQLLLQEKKERIQDLKKENDRLDFYAQFFKSFEHRRIEEPTEEIKAEVQEPVKSPAREPKQTQARRSEKDLIRKNCKECGNEFLSTNPRQEYCKDSCKSKFYRKKGR